MKLTGTSRSPRAGLGSSGPETLRLHRSLVLLSAMLFSFSLAGCEDDSSSPSNVPTTGTLQVTTVTSGDTLDWDGYTLTVGEAEWGVIGLNDIFTISGLAEGEQWVELGDVAVNCSLGGVNPQEVLIVAEDTAGVRFEVSCNAALFNHIAFNSYRDPSNREIYVMKADGSDPANLTNDPGGDHVAHWSPDGTQIAFTSTRDGEL